ncbi:hypothetical protein [Cyanothece sp. BG0011]|uniref:hypothetical protein n=1 Tax=Cyanothece sp. BG0011 TaxID=2082950 RepID=UPI001E38633A|nr:hypothetical protein [Cyanothece sp. BG0011]
MTHVWYTLWFSEETPIYFSSELDEQSLSLHIYIEEDKKYIFELCNSTKTYDIIMSFMFHETVIDMVKYRKIFNIENNAVDFFYTKTSDPKTLKKLLTIKLMILMIQKFMIKMTIIQ